MKRRNSLKVFVLHNSKEFDTDQNAMLIRFLKFTSNFIVGINKMYVFKRYIKVGNYSLS